MKIFIEKEKKEIKRKFQGRVKDLLKELGINQETVIVVRNGELITEEDIIKESDELRILSVVSGG
jgi:sulfur carrier protein